MSPYDLEDAPVDWEGYVGPLLEGARDLGDAITGPVRAGLPAALTPYAEVRAQRQLAVERELVKRDLAYEHERFDHGVVGSAANIIERISGLPFSSVMTNPHALPVSDEWKACVIVILIPPKSDEPPMFMPKPPLTTCSGGTSI